MKPSNQKKILVVAESIDAEDSSGSQANVALIQNLERAGFEILVYHYTRKGIQLKNIQCIAIKEKKFSLLFLLSRIQRKLQHGLKINLAKYLEPVFGFSFTFFNDVESIAAALKEETEFDPDLILTLSKGASFRPHYALLKLPELHEKWMAYIHDPYPFHYYPEPYNWSEPGFNHKIKFFEEVSEKCRWSAFPSLLLKEWMEDHFTGFQGKSLIIPHQLALEIVMGIELPSYFDPQKFNLLHAGSLLAQRDPEPLINAFQLFLNRTPEAASDCRLLFIGNNSDHISVLRNKEKETPQLFFSKGYVAYELVRKMQKLSSVNIILETIAKVSPFLPGKFPHCIAANKPILYLGPKKSEVRRLLGEGYEYWTEADDVEKISVLIEKLYFQWKDNPEQFCLKRSDLHNYLSAEHLEEQIKKVI